VAPNLNAEERRRLIGNDMALLVYLDAPLTTTTIVTTALTVTTTMTLNVDAQFDVACLDAFGEVTQIFVVVQPIGNAQGDYRYGSAFFFFFLSRVFVWGFFLNCFLTQLFSILALDSALR
jgi:hypothetical protein